MGNSVNIRRMKSAGVAVVETVPHHDQRGAFERLYCERALSSLVYDRRGLQINHPRTAAVGAIRGMHYQRSPNAEVKLVRFLRGRVWDVAVDLRSGHDDPRIGIDWPLPVAELSPRDMNRPLGAPDFHGMRI